MPFGSNDVIELMRSCVPIVLLLFIFSREKNNCVYPDLNPSHEGEKLNYKLDHFTYCPLHFTILSRWKYIAFIHSCFHFLLTKYPVIFECFTFHSHSVRLLNFIIQKQHSVPDIKNGWKTHLQNDTLKALAYSIEMINFRQLRAFWSTLIEQISIRIICENDCDLTADIMVKCLVSKCLNSHLRTYTIRSVGRSVSITLYLKNFLKF